MRSYKVFGTKAGIEIYVTTVTSADAGRAVQDLMRREGEYETIRVRDCFENLKFEYDLKTGKKLA